MDNLIPVIVQSRDSQAYRQDDVWNRFSRYAKVPIERDELCRDWYIYKVVWTDKYTCKILSKREDRKYPETQDSSICQCCNQTSHHIFS